MKEGFKAGTSSAIPFAYRFHPIRMMLNSMRWGMMDAKFKGEKSSSLLGSLCKVVRADDDLLLEAQDGLS
jgi:hypothetical protein